MFPDSYFILGMHWSIWNLVFLLAVLAGYFVLRETLVASPPSPRLLAVRYVACVYICALGAQWFAYAFDLSTSIFPPADTNPWRYYFHPLAGPKTLYGAVLVLPVAAWSFVPAGGMRWGAAIDRSAPALFTILGIARIGCLLEGCCYGLRSDRFGIVFPAGSSVQAEQFLAGLVEMNQPALPVLPTQIACAIACFSIAWWSQRRLVLRKSDVFLHAAVSYSVFRFLIEFLRADEARNHFADLSTSQWVAVAILLGVALNRIRERGMTLEAGD